MADKVCLVLLIVPNGKIARGHTAALRAAGFKVRRVPAWDGDRLGFDPQIVVVQLPTGCCAADIATRLRAQARFAPLILIGLSPSADFENERRAGRLSGFDELFPVDIDPGYLPVRLRQLLLTRPPLTPCVTVKDPAA